MASEPPALEFMLLRNGRILEQGSTSIEESGTTVQPLASRQTSPKARKEVGKRSATKMYLRAVFSPWWKPSSVFIAGLDEYETCQQELAPEPRCMCEPVKPTMVPYARPRTKVEISLCSQFAKQLRDVGATHTRTIQQDLRAARECKLFYGSPANMRPLPQWPPTSTPNKTV